jgi:hypothetical protein
MCSHVSWFYVSSYLHIPVQIDPFSISDDSHSHFRPSDFNFVL